MRKSVILRSVVGALLAAAAVFGPVTLFSHLRAARDVVREQMQGITSDVHEAARIRVLLHDTVDQLVKYRSDLDEVAAHAQEAEQAAECATGKLETQTQILSRAKTFLTADHGQIQIGARVYTREQIRDDAQSRLKCCEQLKATVAFQKEVAAKLRQAEKQGLATLREAEQLKLQREADLTELEARLANAGMLREVNELTAKLKIRSLGAQTEMSQAFSEFRKRVRTAELRHEYLTTDGDPGVGVAWDANQSPAGDVSQAITQFLTSQTEP